MADSIGYIQLAEGLRSGCGFARMINGVCAPADIVQTPRYPAFLALMPNLSFAIMVRSLLAAGVCLLVGLLVKGLWSPGAGFSRQSETRSLTTKAACVQAPQLAPVH